MAEPIRVAVAGHRGKVGSILVQAFQAEPGIEYVGGVGSGDDLAAFLKKTRPHALVDFTRPSTALHNSLVAVAAGAAPVVGTSGIPVDGVDKLEVACNAKGLGGIVAPNFAIGAVLLQRFAAMAARVFPAAEVIELHHEGKLDAPSGTAIATAERMAKARGETWEGPDGESVEGVRGGDVSGIRVHSVRLPGLVAHQEVILGSPGETLTIRHDSLDRVSFMPGVLLGLRRIASTPGLTVGLERLLDLP